MEPIQFTPEQTKSRLKKTQELMDKWEAESRDEDTRDEVEHPSWAERNDYENGSE